jgi:hypothetical protein
MADVAMGVMVEVAMGVMVEVVVAVAAGDLEDGGDAPKFLFKSHHFSSNS